MAAKFYFIGIGVLVIIFLVEFVLDQKEHKNVYKQKEIHLIILIALGLFAISFLNRAMILGSYFFIHSFCLFNINNSLVTWVLATLLVDFTYYWYHRSAHTMGWFWAAHSVHHSAEHFDTSVNFRISWTNQISGYFIFYFWLLLLGFDPIMVYIASNIVSFYQSWIHTELIDKMPRWFEYVFNTPSHHRVHHATNPKYLDKNHGGILIIWDRLFGTFQQEEEKPRYGLTTKIVNGNLSTIMFGEWKDLFHKLVSAGSLKQALNYLVKPPGWRPEKCVADTTNKSSVN
jgi:sterol desaturase/sphingolipid hydroxylase (fatty acid hydroxylase superfamily)